MYNLSEEQKEYLKTTFFNINGYQGWDNIAEQLLTAGVCIVAGKEPLWKGGVGNFIKTKEVAHAFGCLEYTFDLPYFLSSKYYEQITTPALVNLAIKKEAIIKQIAAIQNLSKIK